MSAKGRDTSRERQASQHTKFIGLADAQSFSATLRTVRLDGTPIKERRHDVWPRTVRSAVDSRHTSRDNVAKGARLRTLSQNYMVRIDVGIDSLLRRFEQLKSLEFRRRILYPGLRAKRPLIALPFTLQKHNALGATQHYLRTSWTSPSTKTKRGIDLMERRTSAAKQLRADEVPQHNGSKFDAKQNFFVQRNKRRRSINRHSRKKLERGIS